MVILYFFGSSVRLTLASPFWFVLRVRFLPSMRRFTFLFLSGLLAVFFNRMVRVSLDLSLDVFMDILGVVLIFVSFSSIPLSSLKSVSLLATSELYSVKAVSPSPRCFDFPLLNHHRRFPHLNNQNCSYSYCLHLN